MIRKLIVLVVLGLLFHSAHVLALGLGDIELKSGLNQPFDATIQLTVRDESELEGLRIGLASNADFERIGAVRSPFLNELEFNIVVPDRGKPFIKVSSNNPIREPFVDFILEANWPAGRLLREYTVLLDPPTITTERAAPVQAPSTSSAPRPQQAPTTSSRQRVEESSEPAGIIQPTNTASGNFAAPEELFFGPVKSTDTLWDIADSMRPSDGVSVQQMMIALQKENPNAFADNNINNLKRGATLSIEDESVITELTHREAVNEAARQYQEWLAAKEARRAARGEVAAQEAATTGEASSTDTAEAESAAGDSATPEGGLRLLADEDIQEENLSEGGVADIQGDGAEIEKLREELELTNFAAESAREQNAELRDRLTELEEQIQAMQRAIQLKNDDIAQLQQKILADAAATDSTDSADTSVQDSAAEENVDTSPLIENQTVEIVEESLSEAVDETAPDSAEVSTQVPSSTTEDEQTESAGSPTSQQEPIATDIEQETDAGATASTMVDTFVANAKDIAVTVKDTVSGFVSNITTDFSFESVKTALQPDNILARYREDPLIFRIVSGILAVLIILGIVVKRRRSAAEEEFEEFAAPHMEDDGVEEVIEEISDDEFGIGVSEDGIADVLSEADVYISYERYDKAETILKHGIDSEPDRLDYKEKLLEVYYHMKDAASFVAATDFYYADLSADSEVWSKINNMGAEIAPDHHLFGQSVEQAAEFEEAGAEFVESDELEFSSEDYTDINLDIDETVSTELDSEVEAELGLDDENLLADLEDDASDAAEEMYDKASQELESELAASGIPTDKAGDEIVDLGSEELPTLKLDATETIDTDDTVEDHSLVERAMDNFNGESDWNDKYGATNTGEDGLESIAESPLDDVAINTEGDNFDAMSFEGVDVNSTKLDLAKAYIDMGDQEGARSILEEVVEAGNDAQKSEAQDLINQL